MMTTAMPLSYSTVTYIPWSRKYCLDIIFCRNAGYFSYLTVDLGTVRLHPLSMIG
jgi:hypothetical protein